MKILIIAPQYKPHGEYYELPLGMAYISAYLKANHATVWFMNLNEHDAITVEDILWADIVCTGGLSVHYRAIREILIKVKTTNPHIITVVGGGLFSSAPELMYEMLSSYIDVGIVGEGENVLYYLISKIEINRGKTVDRIMNAFTISNLDALPFPDYEGLGVASYLDRQQCGDEYHLYPVDKPRAMPIISSRSCPYNCSFCFHPTGKIYRQRSLDNFFAEVEYLIEKYQVNILSVIDELIAQSPERLNLFCERMKRYKLKWCSQIRVDSVDENTVRMMKDSGCFSMSVGIEHINQRVLDGYNKRITHKQIEDTLTLLYKHGIGIQGNILLCGPDETPETMREAFTWREHNAKYMINMTAVIAYPGTDLFKCGVERGIIKPQQFIEQECPFVNFSGTTLELPMCFTWGRVISFRGGTLVAECPHCHATSAYPDIYWGSTGAAFTQGSSYRIGCRNCNQRMDLRW